MNKQTTFRIAAYVAILALGTTSSIAMAAQGASCVKRGAGSQGASSAVVGHINADGKCVTEAEPKESGGGTGLEASAQCRDLSFSYAKRRDTACAKHGGVMEWLAQQ